SDQTTEEARRTASNGYAAVEGLTRGKGCSPNPPVSHEYDGIDAAALIDWISRQPWSDGRVGMYGGSYEGMTQWAAAKHMPKALKAMMPSVTHAPGIDFPMDGNIFATYAYSWPFFTTGKKQGLDSATYYDTRRWTKLQQTWYSNGTAYRNLSLIDHRPNPVFERWLNHPTYDSYWQNMVASGADFRRIDIPILTTTGYFDGGQMGALWFFRQHTAYRPDAEHYLVVGPYDHITGQRGNLDPLGRRSQVSIQGIDVDSVANIDIGELRYQWFDYVFRGTPRPALLRDKVNYVVMNANVWKHAPSLAAMHDSLITVRLGRMVDQRVDLLDRSDVMAWGPSGDLLDPSSSVRTLVDTIPGIANAITFTSEPFRDAVEVSGLFAGKIDFETNKKAFDFSVTLFELTPDRKYLQLSYHWQRASYAKSRTTRVLLQPGRRTRLQYSSNRLISRRLQPGSRIAVAIAIAKNPSQQINYGTGKDVSAETIADAKVPLMIKWYPATSVEVPIDRHDR
ncbi:MAG TPA: CocE/NonD family hydrolase, partial [Gemmatimonadaceae bacterium]|nr:CocE/NonD family hydrolase [Gemmatimonadaceae bacterium]